MQISTYIHVQTWKSEKSEVKLSQKQITVVAETHVDFVRVGYIYRYIQIDTYIIIPSRRFPYVRFAQFHYHQVHFKCISFVFRVGKMK